VCVGAWPVLKRDLILHYFQNCGARFKQRFLKIY
jgi:hypothetical protein